MKNSNYGFTMIEIMVAMAILAVVAMIAIPAYNGYMRSGYLTECSNEVAAIRLAQQEFFLENNTFFPDPAGLADGIPAIEAASNGIYVSGYTVQADAVATAANLAAANCAFTLVSTAAPSFTITVTGQNNLSVDDSFTFTE